MTDPDPEFPATAARILRGATRLLEGLGYAAIAEYTLGNGRRADILAIDGAGQVTIVEIKSSRADFAADHKWRDYLEFCDRFYFAVEPDFPLALLPRGGRPHLRRRPWRLDPPRRRAATRSTATAAGASFSASR